MRICVFLREIDALPVFCFSFAVGNRGRVRAEISRSIAHDIRPWCLRPGRATEYRGQYKELHETRPNPFP